MTEQTVEERLAVLETKEEIKAFIAQYATLNDARTRLDELIDLFAPEAVLRNPAGEHDGRNAIAAYYRGFFTEEVTFSRHHIVNQVIEVVTPELVHHDAYFLAMLGRQGVSRLVMGNYSDTIARIDGRWQFTEKINDTVAATTLDDGWAAGFGVHEPLQRVS